MRWVADGRARFDLTGCNGTSKRRAHFRIHKVPVEAGDDRALVRRAMILSFNRASWSLATAARHRQALNTRLMKGPQVVTL